MNKHKFDGVDIYELFGLTGDATSNEIKKAYRQKALKYHPDKNPNNPKATETFLKLTEALEILLDESARAAYDNLIKAKTAAKLRHKAFDEKRKKFKEDLEFREQAHFRNKEKTKTEEEKFQAEIDRLQKEGAALIQNEIKLLQEEILKELNLVKPVEDGSSYKIKIEWKCDKNDADNGGYNEEVLEKIFKKHGDLAGLVVSTKHRGQAIVEFKERRAAEQAMKIELGFMYNPLKLKYIDSNVRRDKKNFSKSDETLVNERDYESLVLRKMRQAEERRKLMEEMKREDEADEC